MIRSPVTGPTSPPFARPPPPGLVLFGRLPIDTPVEPELPASLEYDTMIGWWRESALLLECRGLTLMLQGTRICEIDSSSR